MHLYRLIPIIPLDPDIRHTALRQILRTIATTLGEDEYKEIKVDYDEKSRAFFPRSYRPPPDLRFTNSDALFPPDELRADIEPGYEEECRPLFFRPHPSFAEVLERFTEIRNLV